MFINGSAAGFAAGDLLQMKLLNHPLVVLAGCNTGIGRSKRNTGVTSFAFAFLSAEAGPVSATPWDVDDEATRQFAVLLHRALSGEKTFPWP